MFQIVAIKISYMNLRKRQIKSFIQLLFYLRCSDGYNTVGEVRDVLWIISDFALYYYELWAVCLHGLLEEVH